jgi:hypothetical protein
LRAADASFRSLASPPRALRWASMADRAVFVLQRRCFPAWFGRRPACRPREQRPASVTSETFAVLLASKRVVSFNWEVFGHPHNLHRVDGGRADTSIFRLARDHRGEAPNRRNAHNNGACGYDSCSHVGAPFKTNMSASVRFHSCLPVIKKFRMKKWAGQSLTLNYAALVSLNLRVLKQFPVRRGYRGLGGHGSRGSEDRRVERPDTERH